MMENNFLKAFINSNGDITIASGVQDGDLLSDIQVSAITVSHQDLRLLADSLVSMARQLDEEAEQNEVV